LRDPCAALAPRLDTAGAAIWRRQYNFAMPDGDACWRGALGSDFYRLIDALKIQRRPDAFLLGRSALSTF